MTSEHPTGGSWTFLARLVRPQGRYGEILADVLTDFPERFADRKRLFLVSSEAAAEVSREAALENHWLHKNRIVFKFAGVDSIDEADSLRGLYVAIPMEERAPLTDGSVYIGDLIGCEFVDVRADAKPLGVVADVDRESGLLVVKTAGGAEALIPFVSAWLAKMDLAGKRIEMRLPPGLLDINSPITEEERRELESE